AQVTEPEAGDRLPVVLLHPTPLGSGFWEPVARGLAGYRLVIPDLRGHGRSPLGAAASDQGLTMVQLAEDALALLDTLGVERAVFAGCSIGGYTLYELWRRAPERMAGLVFCSSKPQADNEVERARRQQWIGIHEARRAEGLASPAPEFVETMLGTLLSKETQREQPQRVSEVRSMMEQVRPEAIQAVQRGLAARPDSRETARTMTAPSCVIAGEQDGSSTPEDLQALHALLEQAGSASEFHVLAQAGHYAAMEQPAATAAILLQFCRSIFP
ncbi:MAG TPA: alpha/beta fold hydrolase, partial [Acidobacteriaceae bacterium]